MASTQGKWRKCTPTLAPKENENNRIWGLLLKKKAKDAQPTIQIGNMSTEKITPARAALKSRGKQTRRRAQRRKPERP